MSTPLDQPPPDRPREPAAQPPGGHEAAARRSVRIGIQLPEVERVVRWPEYAAMARTAEAAGFDSLWVGDHLLYRGDGRGERAPWEAYTLLASLAAVTERVRLGPLVACAGFHPPTLIAKMASTIDEISGGRFVLGLGAGWNRTEFDAFGIPFDRRVDRFAEAWPIIRDLVAGERSTLAGRHWSSDDAVLLPPRRGGGAIPLMVGSNGERMLELTLADAAAWNTWFVETGNRPTGFETLSHRVSEIAERVGRDPSTIERSVCVLVRLTGPGGAGGERPHDDLAPAIVFGEGAGAARRLADELGAFADAGADEIIVVADPITEVSVGRLGEVVALVAA